MRGKERPGVAAWEGVRGRASCVGLNAHLPFQVADNLTTTTPTSGSHTWCPQVLFWEKGLGQGSLFNTETKPAVTSLRLLQLNVQLSMSCFQFPDIAWTWKLLNEANCFGSSVGDSHVDPFSGSQSAAGHSARSLLQGPRFGRETPRGPIIDWLPLCRVAAIYADVLCYSQIHCAFSSMLNLYLHHGADCTSSLFKWSTQCYIKLS